MENSQKCLGMFLWCCPPNETSHVLKILMSEGIRGYVLQQFHNYLFSWVQHVKIQHYIIETLNVQIGIPQGTVPGPLILIKYLNSIISMKIHELMVSYADYTVLLFEDII